MGISIEDNQTKSVFSGGQANTHYERSLHLGCRKFEFDSRCVEIECSPIEIVGFLGVFFKQHGPLKPFMLRLNHSITRVNPSCHWETTEYKLYK